MLVIRKATREDVPVILHLVKALAAYEKEPDAVVATEADYLRDGFGEHPLFHVLLAENDGDVLGFALYYFNWSTWLGHSCLYLEDLFVVPERRRNGAGIALMRALAKIAKDEGCPKFIWQVLDWNEPSIKFYESLGAGVERQWLTVKIGGEALTRLSC